MIDVIIGKTALAPPNHDIGNKRVKSAHLPPYLAILRIGRRKKFDSLEAQRSVLILFPYAEVHIF